MKTKEQIKAIMTTSFMSNETLANKYGFNVGDSFDVHFSIVSIENVWFEIVAFCIFVHEQIFDQHKKEIDFAISEQKSGTPNWYKNKSLAFQNGFDLFPDSDVFDNSDATPQQIESSKIVKYCSVKESQESNRLIIKIASESNGELEPLTLQQIESFTEYISEIKYAGVRIRVINNPADLLILDLVVFRDPLVINENGLGIKNGDRPVEDRIKLYMKELPFNGELVINDLIEQLRRVPGVRDVFINSATSSFYEVDGYTDFTSFNVKRIPEAGYFKLENFDNVSYVV